jgi:glucose/arabinose dehydrogenase
MYAIVIVTAANYSTLNWPHKSNRRLEFPLDFKVQISQYFSIAVILTICLFGRNGYIVYCERKQSFMMLLSILFGIMVISISAVVTSSAAFGQESQLPQVSDPDLTVEQVAEGLTDPTTMGFLGDDDILVLEKAGTVQRIGNDGLLDEQILTVNVDDEDERGLLGIEVVPNDNGTSPYVFLSYTENVANTSDGQEEVRTRLYRYEFQNNELINPKLLLDLPADPGSAHNGGVISIGPDDNIYLTLGELIRTDYARDDFDTQAQNYENGKKPDGRGGILRVSQDGEIVQPSILGDEHPLDMYYAYGIRNSFGIDFDPITGNLWDTENGPSFGDEINLVEPGFNSGWAKVAGINEVIEDIEVDTGDNEEKRKISKGKEILSTPDGLVDFNGNGKYSPPELSGRFIPTQILFFNSSKLGEEYSDDVFVATVGGTIYRFELNPDRTNLLLKGALSNQTDVDETDLEDVIFAQGFGIITDIEEGPDGYMYVVSGVREDNGKVHRITPSL